MVDSGWYTGNHNPRPPPRVRKTDTFIVFYLFVLHSVTCLKTCHFTAGLTSLWTSISVFYVNTARDVVTVLLIFLLNIHHFAYTFSYSHTEAHTHKHTCIISTQEEWRQPDTGAWLRGDGKRLLLDTNKKGGKKCQKKSIFTNLKKRIRAHRASSKATRLFLTK